MSSLASAFSVLTDLLRGALPPDGASTRFSFYKTPSRDFTDLPAFGESQFGNHPAQRKCCTIGWQNATWAPLTATDPLALGDLRGEEHDYTEDLGLFFSYDEVGHIYTRTGGIIDVAHARDHADYTAFLAVQSRSRLESGGTLALESEAGSRTVRFTALNRKPTALECALVGANLSYQLAVWHELVTWAAKDGTIQTPYQPYSAFSPEDNYSNLLGTYLGFRALMTPNSTFDESMPLILVNTLQRLGAVGSEETVEAVEYVKGHWYRYHTGDSPYLVLLRRHFDALGTVTPWLIPAVDIPAKAATRDALRKRIGHPLKPAAIHVPDKLPDGTAISAHARLEIELDAGPFGTNPVTGFTGTVVSTDFPALIAAVKADVLIQFPDGDQP